MAHLSHALVTIGFATLAFGALMVLLSMTAAELENTAQAVAWSTAGFFAGLAGALIAVVGALLGRRHAA